MGEPPKGRLRENNHRTKVLDQPLLSLTRDSSKSCRPHSRPSRLVVPSAWWGASGSGTFISRPHPQLNPTGLRLPVVLQGYSLQGGLQAPHFHGRLAAALEAAESRCPENPCDRKLMPNVQCLPLLLIRSPRSWGATGVNLTITGKCLCQGTGHRGAHIPLFLFWTVELGLGCPSLWGVLL